MLNFDKRNLCWRAMEYWGLLDFGYARGASGTHSMKLKFHGEFLLSAQDATPNQSLEEASHLITGLAALPDLDARGLLQGRVSRVDYEIAPEA